MGGESNGKIAVSWVIQVGLFVIGWLTSALLAYGMARSDIAVLQTKQSETDRRLENIENKAERIPSIEAKIDALLRRNP